MAFFFSIPISFVLLWVETPLSTQIQACIWKCLAPITCILLLVYFILSLPWSTYIRRFLSYGVKASSWFRTLYALYLQRRYGYSPYSQHSVWRYSKQIECSSKKTKSTSDSGYVSIPPARTHIAVVTGYDVLIHPERSEFNLLFQWIRRMGWSVELLETLPEVKELKPIHAIFLGAPQSRFSSEERQILHRWIEQGGHLLYLASVPSYTKRSGDVDKVCTDFFEEAVRVPDQCLISVNADTEDVAAERPFRKRRDVLPHIEIDVSNCTGDSEPLVYAYGSSLEMSAPSSRYSLFDSRGGGVIGPLFPKSKDTPVWWNVTHALQVPVSGIQTVAKARIQEDTIGVIHEEDDVSPLFSNRVERSVMYHSDVTTSWQAGFAFLRTLQQKGSVTFFGAGYSFHNDLLHFVGNRNFLQFLLSTWLDTFARHELHRRMQLPQRHRLLHGYPMLPVMKPLGSFKAMEHVSKASKEHALQLWFQNKEQDDWQQICVDEKRAQIVGVLPHSFCNPKLEACGFCTFPHEPFRRGQAEAVVAHVEREIRSFAKQFPDVCSRDVRALYFGGGTANLTPLESFRSLCQTLNHAFDLHNSEITLEGIPISFTSREFAFFDMLEASFPNSSLRLSMGVQTFQPELLKKMGRESFGDPKTFRALLDEAQKRGFQLSGDFLCNLPGQTLEQMQEDLGLAIDLGFRHICLYHLVMFEGLATPWARDSSLVQQLPSHEQACENWQILRSLLCSLGFVQTSLTNFEHRDLHQSPSRFIYEDCSYQIEHYDALGFGPAGIGYLQDAREHKAIKVSNAVQSHMYMASVKASERGWQSTFFYTEKDCKILHLTRKIAMLSIDVDVYKNRFGTHPFSDFPDLFEVLLTAQLLSLKDQELQLTPKGMFYADSIAGLFAHMRIQELRLNDALRSLTPTRPWTGFDLNMASGFHMG